MIPNNLNSFANNRSNYQMREQFDRMENESEQQLIEEPIEKSFFEKPPVAAKLDQKAPIAKPVEVNLSDRRIAQKRPETPIAQPTVMPAKPKTASLNQALENLAKQAITNIVVTKNTPVVAKPAPTAAASTAKSAEPTVMPKKPRPAILHTANGDVSVEPTYNAKTNRYEINIDVPPASAIMAKPSTAKTETKTNTSTAKPSVTAQTAKPAASLNVPPKTAPTNAKPVNVDVKYPAKPVAVNVDVKYPAKPKDPGYKPSQPVPTPSRPSQPVPPPVAKPVSADVKYPAKPVAVNVDVKYPAKPKDPGYKPSQPVPTPSRPSQPVPPPVAKPVSADVKYPAKPVAVNVDVKYPAKPKDPGYKPSQPVPTPSRPSQPVPPPVAKPVPTPVPTPTKPVITPAGPRNMHPPTNKPVITPAMPGTVNPPTNKPVIAPARPGNTNPPITTPKVKDPSFKPSQPMPTPTPTPATEKKHKGGFFGDLFHKIGHTGEAIANKVVDDVKKEITVQQTTAKKAEELLKNTPGVYKFTTAQGTYEIDTSKYINAKGQFQSVGVTLTDKNGDKKSYFLTQTSYTTYKFPGTGPDGKPNTISIEGKTVTLMPTDSGVGQIEIPNDTELFDLTTKLLASPKNGTKTESGRKVVVDTEKTYSAYTYTKDASGYKLVLKSDNAQKAKMYKSSAASNYVPGTKVTTDSGTYVIDTKNTGGSNSNYEQITVTKYNNDGSKTYFTVSDTRDVTYQYYGMGKNEEAWRSNEKTVYLKQNNQPGNVPVVNDQTMFNIVSLLLGKASNNSGLTVPTNQFITGDKSTKVLTLNDRGESILIPKSGIYTDTPGPTTTPGGAATGGVTPGATNPNAVTTPNLNQPTTTTVSNYNTTTNNYKDKPPVTNNGDGTITLDPSKGIGSSYTISKTDTPNVQYLLNSAGAKIATVTLSYNNNGEKTTRLEFADHTTIDYSGKDTKISFDSKGNVTAVAGNNANVIFKDKTTPVTVTGNNTSTTILGKNKEVNIKGDGSKILTGQQGTVINVDGNGTIINKAAGSTAKKDGDTVNTKGNGAFINLGASTISSVGFGAEIKGHEIVSYGDDCKLSGTQMYDNDKIYAYGDNVTTNGGNKKNGKETEDIVVYSPQKVLEGIITADSNEISAQWMKEKEQNEATMLKYIQNDTNAIFASLDKQFENDIKEINNELINNGALNANGHAYTLSFDKNGKTVWTDPDTGKPKDTNGDSTSGGTDNVKHYNQDEKDNPFDVRNSTTDGYGSDMQYYFDNGWTRSYS